MFISHASASVYKRALFRRQHQTAMQRIIAYQSAFFKEHRLAQYACNQTLHDRKSNLADGNVDRQEKSYAQTPTRFAGMLPTKTHDIVWASF